jgi:hypothetical protein
MNAQKMNLVSRFIQDLAMKAEIDEQICSDYNALSDDKVLLDFLTDFATKTNDNLEFATKSAPAQEPPKVPEEHKI